MRVPTSEEIQRTESGFIEIDDARNSDMHEAEVFTNEYTKLVQDNPEYIFSLDWDVIPRNLTLRWKRRT